MLGAILVNNEAFYRVSDFLEPKHFFEPIHQQIYELAGRPDSRQQVATPVTLKTFLPAEHRHRRTEGHQYLARLAAEATTVINAADYGRTIYDLVAAPRPDRHRRGDGQPRLRCAGRCRAARARSRTPSAALRVAETGRYDGGFQRFAEALDHRGRHGGARLPARRQTVGPRHRAERSRPHDGRPAAVRPDHRRRPPRHGQNLARHQHRLQRRQGLARRAARRRPHADGQRRHRRLLLAGNVGRAARHPHYRRAVRHPVEPDPARRHQRRRFRRSSRTTRRDAEPAASTSTRPAASRSPSSRPARAGSSASAASICW